MAWLNRSNILYAGNDRWTSDPRVRLLINTPEEFSILITQVGLGDEGLYTCSFQTRHQPYTTQVYLIVHGEGPGVGGAIPGYSFAEGRHTPAPMDFSQREGQSHREGPFGVTASGTGELKGKGEATFTGLVPSIEHLLCAGTAPGPGYREGAGRAVPASLEVTFQGQVASQTQRLSRDLQPGPELGLKKERLGSARAGVGGESEPGAQRRVPRGRKCQNLEREVGWRPRGSQREPAGGRDRSEAALPRISSGLESGSIWRDGDPEQRQSGGAVTSLTQDGWSQTARVHQVQGIVH